MSPKQPTCSRFYILPKIHKDRNNPPGRPIVSANGHPTEHISENVSESLNQLVPKLPSYIKDATHFLNKLCSISAIPNDSLFVTLDLSSLYTNIPHTEGIQVARIYLNKRTLKTPPTETVCDLIDLILTNNYFEFNGQHFLQKQGTAMGTWMAPPYANLFMGTFESDALEKALVKITEHHLLSPITPLCHSYLPSSNKTSTYYRTPKHAKKSSLTYPYSATVDLKTSGIYWFVQE